MDTLNNLLLEIYFNHLEKLNNGYWYDRKDIYIMNDILNALYLLKHGSLNKYDENKVVDHFKIIS